MKYLNFLILFLSVTLFLSCSKFKKNNLEWKWSEQKAYRWAKLNVEPEGKTGFEKLDSTITNISFKNYLPTEDMARNRHYLNGSGVAAGDINGDGWTDLYFARLNGSNKLYKNLGGMKFEDITASAGVAHTGYYSTGSVFADVNGDGHLDLLVSAMHKENVLYINDGSESFIKKENSGLGTAKGSMTMTLADITGDGYLDLYITNYKEKPVISLFSPSELTREKMVQQEDNQYKLKPPFDKHYYILEDKEYGPTLHELGEKDELYLNNGNGSFEKVTDLKNHFYNEEGTPRGLFPDWGLTAKFHDFNDDGSPDLYVANDFWTPDRVWINQGNGRFKTPSDKTFKRFSFSSMGVDFSDINRDGFTDIFVIEMLDPEHEKRMSQMSSFSSLFVNTAETYEELPYRHNRNSLYLNRGDHSYAEISWYSGVAASGWSWATRFMDVTLNGYEDLLITNGFPLDVLDIDSQHQIRGGRSNVQNGSNAIGLYQHNYAFRNNGDLTFSNMSAEWGFIGEDVSQGMAVADLDNDGALEVIVNRLNQEALIYHNTSGSPRIAVRLKGRLPNSQAIGAKLELTGGPVSRQSKQITSGGDYLSGSDPLVMFAAEAGDPNHRLTITWPDGQKSHVDSLQANRIYEIYEATISKSDVEVDPSKPKQSMFEDISDQLGHVHKESKFDDFSIQSLLPIRLSRQGPGVAWLDVTGDSHEDLLIGSGRGGELALYENGTGSHLVRKSLKGLSGTAQGDQTGLAGWTEAAQTHLVVGMANYEQGTTGAASVLHVQIEQGRVVSVDSLPGTLSTTGPLAVADYNRDGRMDLFVGGRFVPGQYPMDASSRLFLGSEKGFKIDKVNTAKLHDIGMVTSALFVDYNNNGQQDLLMATEWGELRLFGNRGGKFTELTEEVGLTGYKGWWRGIATGDFTGNGYADIVATNWGKNTPYQFTTPDKPLRMYYADLNRDGLMDIIESYYDQTIGGYVPRRKLDDLKSTIPNLSATITSNRKFAQSDLKQILNMDTEKTSTKELNTLQHMVFINKGGTEFTAKMLPAIAQMSAGSYAGVADMNNDGNEDVFISQNNFAYREQPNRPDAGRGLWLAGDGDGNFKPVPGHKSGVIVYGDQRGAALSDFNSDGKVDLVVAQNADSTHLFVNRTVRQGIKVRLLGPKENSSAIGSSIRLVYKDGSKGPVRFIQAGSGYWSQNSSRPVLGTKGDHVAIEIRWFDGTEQTVALKENQNNIVVQYQNSTLN